MQGFLSKTRTAFRRCAAGTIRSAVLFAGASVLLCACMRQPLPTVAPPEQPSSAQQSAPADTSSVADTSSAKEQPKQPDLSGLAHIQNVYICSVIDEVLAQTITDDMTDVQKVTAVYRRLVTETAFFDEPVGTDIWRYRGDPENIPTIYEIRSISPLLFGIGSCEDYASAFVTLCDRMGFEALYVPGLTYSVEGKLVDHAWAMVKLEGNWYHADPQLEDNIMREGRLRYRYFLKDDRVMGADHRWGAMLEEPSDYALTLPACEQEADPPEQEIVIQPERPSKSAIEKRLAQERELYLLTHPPLTDYLAPELPGLT